MQALTGCKICFPEAALFFLDECKDLIGHEEKVPPFTVDSVYDYQTELHFGNISVKPILSAGHTPGCASFLFDAIHNGKSVTCGMQGGTGLNGITTEELQKNQLPLSLQSDFLEALASQASLPVECYLPVHFSEYNIIQQKQLDDGIGNCFINNTMWSSCHINRANAFAALLKP